MKISACIIAKNEEKNIARCIESFKDIVFQTIVVDTGSVDKTVEIAKRLGAEIYFYPWDNSFANAKNCALDKVKGDWVIFLDADEYFKEGKAFNIPIVIGELSKKMKIDGITCMMTNTNGYLGKVNNTIVTLRIYKYYKNLRYKGAVHECLTMPGKAFNYAFVEEDKISLYHTGYSTETGEGKAKRNLELILSTDYEKDPKNYYYLSDCYLVLGEYEQSIKFARKFIDSKVNVFGFNSRPYQNIIDSMLRLEYNSNKLIEIINEALNKFPKHPVFYLQLARVYYNNRNYVKALENFEYTMYYQERFDGTELNFVSGVMYEVYYYTGLLNEYKNNYINALEFYIKALKQSKYSTQAFFRLIQLVKKQPYEESGILLNSIYDINQEKDVEFICNQLSLMKAKKILMYYTNLWLKKYNHMDSVYIYNLLSNGYYNEAFDKFYNVYRSNYKYWSAISCVISALLSKNENNIKLIIDCIKPSFRRIIKAYFDFEQINFIESDMQDYLNILNEFCLMEDKESILKILSLNIFFHKNVYFEIGNILKENNYYELAIENYNLAIKNNDTLFYKSICYFKLGKYNEAAKILLNLMLNDKNEAVFSYLQWTYENIKDIKLKNNIKKAIKNRS